MFHKSSYQFDIEICDNFTEISKEKFKIGSYWQQLKPISFLILSCLLPRFPLLSNILSCIILYWPRFHTRFREVLSS